VLSNFIKAITRRLRHAADRRQRGGRDQEQHDA
jgi:hypothetical protein